MENVLAKLLAKSPNLLSKFQVLTSDVASPEKWNTGPTFVTKQIGCICGSRDVRVATIQRAGKAGIFKKKPVVTYSPPVYISCPKCSSTELLFDPAIHGWNGQEESDRPQPNEGGAVAFRDSAGSVLVNYSYQGIENYEDLFEDGVQNPEDYFDTFTIYFREQGSDTFEQVLSCECA